MVPTESAPLLQDGKVIRGNRQSCEAAAQAFYVRLQAEAELKPEEHIEDLDKRRLPPYRGKIDPEHEQMSLDYSPDRETCSSLK